MGTGTLQKEKVAGGINPVISNPPRDHGIAQVLPGQVCGFCGKAMFVGTWLLGYKCWHKVHEHCYDAAQKAVAKNIMGLL